MNFKALNSLSAEQITKVVQIRFGEDYVAVARKGRRWIRKTFPGTLMIQQAPAGATWEEALRLAKVDFGWTQ